MPPSHLKWNYGTQYETRGPMTKLIGRLLTLAAGTLLLVAGLMASVALLTIAAILGAGFLAYFWWKIRPLRKEMDEQRRAASAAPKGTVIEGESVVIEEGDDIRPERGGVVKTVRHLR